ncbi:PREDICTED: 1-phosphatidylinositol phosphodiesterase-like [Gekko japonicus]|uniref:1-phosphatidylinositol phosphodiesterase-like n=1 Tax=Gekko japonicus TaxID=146911 RepID=A0ABM1KE54_GEKJA|nr:PREDICTED: 1-phosphatidylinositol phosphodiesterase-like [Gekko japonicus]
MDEQALLEDFQREPKVTGSTDNLLTSPSHVASSPFQVNLPTMDQTESFDNTPQPVASLPDWMSDLPDHLSISRISIPGTHDTMSLFGGSNIRCQSWPLEAQLEAGIRFLDIRCKLEEGHFLIYHVNTYQEADFSTVLKVTLSFLKRHPRETVLMRVKEELPILPDADFGPRLRRYLDEEGQGQVWVKEAIPTLGEARGKIVILEELENEILGVPYEALSVGDSWHVLSAESKWDRVLEHLDTAETTSHATLHLTFCSGNGLFTNPEELAQDINQRCYEHLKAQAGKAGRWGVVIMDFPGAGLIRNIVESNLKTGNDDTTARL